MTGPLLRTGSLKAFHPLGAVGNPVYLAASQLRAAISRRLGAEVADTFAIPQRNEDGDTIDWYAAQSGPVVPWSAATAQERAEAQERLLDMRTRIEQLAGAMRQEPDAERQVFGRLLEHVTTFPDDEHVYLVNDAPVVTFWGFLLSDAAVGSDPLLNLDLLDDQPADAAPGVSPKRRVPWWLWLLLPLLLIPLLLFLLRACQEPPPGEHVTAETPAPVADGQTPIEDGAAVLSEEPLLVEPAEETLISDDEQPEVLVDDRRTRRVEIERGSAGVEVVDSVTELQNAETQVRSEQTATEEVITEEAGIAEEIPVEATEGDVEATLAESAEPVEESAPEGAAATSEVEEAALSEPGPKSEAESDGEEVEPPVEPAVDPVPEEAVEDSAAEVPTDRETSEEQGEQALVDEPLQAEQAKPEPEPADQEQPPTTEADPNAASPGAGAEPTSRPGESLTMPTTPTGSRSTRFLNGGWRTATSLQDPKTGLPINLEYQLKDGAGKVRLKRHDGSACEGDVKAGLDGGKLVIDSTGNIVCADGTNFGRPKLECKPGADGKADCQGRYPSGETFSVDINKKNR